LQEDPKWRARIPRTYKQSQDILDLYISRERERERKREREKRRKRPEELVALEATGTTSSGQAEDKVL